jgi:ferredoxin
MANEYKVCASYCPENGRVAVSVWVRKYQKLDPEEWRLCAVCDAYDLARFSGPRAELEYFLSGLFR